MGAGPGVRSHSSGGWSSKEVREGVRGRKSGVSSHLVSLNWASRERCDS